jgi:hypothetical protein
MLRLTSALLAFGVELAMLCAFGAWGLHLPYTLFVRLGVAIALVLAVAVLWGQFLSPMAPRRLPLAPRALSKVAVFAVGTAAAWTCGLILFAEVIAVLAAVSLVLEFIVGVPPVVEPPAR